MNRLNLLEDLIFEIEVNVLFTTADFYGLEKTRQSYIATLTSLLNTIFPFPQIGTDIYPSLSKLQTERNYRLKVSKLNITLVFGFFMDLAYINGA